MSTSNNIKVVARFRPQNQIELSKDGNKCIKVIEDHSVLVQANETSANFTFDKTFDENTSQQELFSYSIGQTIEDLFNGYNGTVLAYGQTGSGKTYTMMGNDIESDYNKGIIPRIVEGIFDRILNSPSSIEYLVKVSYLEIYMEKVRDLLNPSRDNLQIHETKANGVYVKDLIEVFVGNINEVYATMKEGSKHRIVAETNMNEESSRSHSIFQLAIQQTNTTDGKIKLGKLYLVDLAGSEKLGKTGATGQTLEEAKKINKSLSALGNVINALTDGKSTHIPYRNSKLTRILQESLGGNSRTTLIINCSPSSYNVNETLSTLRFGTRAKSIKNKATINQELSSEELKEIINKLQTKTMNYKSYIIKLEGELTLWRDGKSVQSNDQISWQKFNGSNSLNTPNKNELDLKLLNSANPASRLLIKDNDLHNTETPKTNLNNLSVSENQIRNEYLTSSEVNRQPPGFNYQSNFENSRMDLADGTMSPLLPLSTVSSNARSETRSKTPNYLSISEKEEFLRRENELVDLLSEKEKTILDLKQIVENLSEDLEQLKGEQKLAEASNIDLVLKNTKIKSEKLSSDDKNSEYRLVIDQLKESLDEKERENKDYKVQLEDHKEQIIYLKAKNSFKEKNYSQRNTDIGSPKDETTKSPKPTIQFIEAILNNSESEINESMLIRKNDPELKMLIFERCELLKADQVDYKQVYTNFTKENEILFNKLSKSQSSYNRLFKEYEEHLRNSLSSHEKINKGKLEKIEEIVQNMDLNHSSIISKQDLEIQKLNSVNNSQNKELNYYKKMVENYKYKEHLKDNIDSQVLSDNIPAEKIDTVSNGTNNNKIENIHKQPSQKIQTQLNEPQHHTVNDELVLKLNEQYEVSMVMEKKIDALETEISRLRVHNSTSVKSKRMAIIEKTIIQLKEKSEDLITQNKELKNQLTLSERKIEHFSSRNESLKAEVIKLTVEIGQLNSLNQRLSSNILSNKRKTISIPSGLKALPFGKVAKPIRGGGGNILNTESSLPDLFSFRSISLNPSQLNDINLEPSLNNDNPSYITNEPFLYRMSQK
ncbi:hypothetical protein BB561_000610 [Smittium simulii]|uniref:Kinesin motor domain-containing protein n=1 Tax=Smittium simulii TaxID=133385 RepID=A0A2T9YYG5_9FUNG|nr:hypothetical protein BB561_000610 [Smittium simulii]